MSKRRGDGPLGGVRILDIGTMLAGPVACTLLADLGADVVKVEQPQRGDTIRDIGPFVDGESLYWNVEGRNKRSVAIDLRLEAGQAALRRLVSSADVLVENFRPGTLRKWGLDFDRLVAVNPQLIMLSVSGYGQTGPYAERPAYDRNGLAFGGLMHMTGYPDRPPVRPGTSVADYQSALFGAFGIMVALYNRDARGGGGEHIDVSLFESVFRFTDMMVTAFDRLGVKRERRGNKHFAAAPGDHFLTSDGRFIIVTASNNAVFRRLCNAMNRSELAGDPRFQTHETRWQNIDELNLLVAEWILQHPVHEVIQQLELHGVTHSLMYSVEDILSDPHYAARGAIQSVSTRIGNLKMQSSYPYFRNSPAPALRAAPRLGEHTREVLLDWGDLREGDVQQLAAEGVVAVRDTERSIDNSDRRSNER